VRNNAGQVRRHLSSPPTRQTTGIEAPDRDQDAENNGLRARRATGDVDINREYLIDTAKAGVSLPEDAPGGAGTYGDHDARVGNGLDRAADGSFKVARDRAGDNDPVRMARGGNEIDAKAADVVYRVQQGGEFPVAGVAGTRVEVAEVQRPTQHLVDIGQCTGGIGFRIWCLSRRRTAVSSATTSIRKSARQRAASSKSCPMATAPAH
jgi:hypothetical protein